MDDKLLIKVLELLEGTYPEGYHVNRLTNKLKVSIDGEFSKIIKYLEKSKKIEIIRRLPEHIDLQQNDEIGITNEGIDFLIKKKLEKREEEFYKITEKQSYTNFMLAFATIILAFGVLFQVFNSIAEKEFSEGNDIKNLLTGSYFQLGTPIQNTIMFYIVISLISILFILFLIYLWKFFLKSQFKKLKSY